MPRDPFECRCVLCHDYGDRDEADPADLMIVENVARHGWHVVMVPEDDIGPGFAYTIGLAHTHSVPELAMFGLDVHDMHRMLNTLGDRAAAGTPLDDGQEHQDVTASHPVVLRVADLRWYRTYFGRAIRFYRRPPFPVLQVAWPDAEGRFHWEEQTEEGHRQSQPQLWLRPDEHPVGTWTAEV
ncbi:DUF4262 domain-containing protein [Streptomyces sp. NBC_00873]|uniref:DUF4262 domain-containing protein n=1 Tax=unclassified Streptomyces TaxID=2593676 RepID=UPI0038680A61|nr:DUF4262 domain-containing protein [Streptomyces sp. NBC_00873]WTA46014.1 DUF4262 domain-containing protein [Streptomyces sp. NBC_00842]